MSTSSNRTKAFCPALPRKAHGGKFVNLIVRPRMYAQVAVYNTEPQRPRTAVWIIALRSCHVESRSQIVVMC